MNNLQRFRIVKEMYERECSKCQRRESTCDETFRSDPFIRYKNKLWFYGEIENRRCTAFVRREDE